MHSFLFITHLTPVSKRTPLREMLFQLMRESLENQTYPNWKALWIGEKEIQHTQKIIEVDASTTDKLQSVYLREDIRKVLDEHDYFVKLDDDDIILPRTLEKYAQVDFDAGSDKWHTFCDVVTTRVTQQKRCWMPSTTIHKKEWAMLDPKTGKISDNFISSVFYSDHSLVWHEFYKNKKVIFSHRKSPLYVRILSPTSITAGENSSTETNLDGYFRYLSGFGTWFPIRIKDFHLYKNKIIQINKIFYPEYFENNIPASKVQRLKDLVHYYLIPWKN